MKTIIILTALLAANSAFANSHNSRTDTSVDKEAAKLTVERKVFNSEHELISREICTTIAYDSGKESVKCEHD